VNAPSASAALRNASSASRFLRSFPSLRIAADRAEKSSSSSSSMKDFFLGFSSSGDEVSGCVSGSYDGGVYDGGS
jgi:hypothetical protein